MIVYLSRRFLWAHTTARSHSSAQSNIIKVEQETMYIMYIMYTQYTKCARWVLRGGEINGNQS